MNDREIAEGLKLGAPEAFQQLYGALGRSVFSYLVRVTGRTEMAEELTQETFLTAIRKISFFQPGPDGGLRAWVFRIASHRALDVLRREKRMELSKDGELPEQVDSSPGPLGELELDQFSERLKEALERLTPAQRMIFLLREQEGLGTLEISRTVGCSEAAVKQSLHRSRSTLRKRLCQDE